MYRQARIACEEALSGVPHDDCKLYGLLAEMMYENEQYGDASSNAARAIRLAISPKQKNDYRYLLAKGIRFIMSVSKS
jgi:hypothetical protein